MLFKDDLNCFGLLEFNIGASLDIGIELGMTEEREQKLALLTNINLY